MFLMAIIGSMVFSGSSDAAKYDASWRADAVTESGKYKEKFVFNLQVSLGQISGVVSAKKKSYQLEGAVDSNGRFVINIVGMAKDGFRGSMRGNTGEGTWNTDKYSGSTTLKK